MVGSSQKFTWNTRREEAAGLLAADHLTDEQIAEQAGITRRQLAKWKVHPDFAARVQSHVDQTRAAVAAKGIADLQNRIDALNDRWQRMTKVIEARARDYGAAPLAPPGADTGLLVPKPMLVKVYETGDRYDEDGEPKPEDPAADEGEVLYSGKRSATVYTWAVDTGLLHELREHEKHAAQQLGQWKDQIEHSGSLTLADLVIKAREQDAHAEG